MGDITTDLLLIPPDQMYARANTLLNVDQLVGFGLNKDLAKAIDSLDRNGYAAYVKIVNNNGLVILVNHTLNTEHDIIGFEVLRLHHTIITQNFDILIDNLFYDGGFGTRLKLFICHRLVNFREPIPLSIYRGIYDCAMGVVLQNRHNKNFVVETPTNVHVAREIEGLNLTNYRLLIDFFTGFRYFNKNSVSESIVFSARFNPQIGQIDYIKARDILTARNIFFKIFPIGPLTLTTGAIGTYNTIGLETESSIYNQLFKLVEFGVTPNVLCSVWSGKIDRFDIDFIFNDRLPPDFRAACMPQITTINRANHAQHPEGVWGQTGIIMTLAGDNVLGDVIGTCTAAERKQIMFQLIYTLYVFDHLEISHGDLHTGNIFVQNILPKRFSFSILGRHFTFTTTKLVKIYDFDHATICKNTNIHLDIHSAFTISSVLNPLRAHGQDFNGIYAETNIYNKNLDLIILIAHGLSFGISNENYMDFILFDGRDEEFNRFLRFIMPGFYRHTPMGQRTIRDTYRELLGIVENRIEPSRIFNTNISGPMDINTLNISEHILNMTWSQYYMYIRNVYGRIVKNSDRVPNNQLWLPDNVVYSKGLMLLSPYFNEYLSREHIDVSRGTVYSIDGRML
jgi:hypothetical protein